MKAVECDVLDYARTDSSGLTTLEKMHYMARPQPIDFVEGDDGVWRQKRLRGWDDARRYGHMADSFDYFTKYAGNEWPHYGIWIDRSMI